TVPNRKPTQREGPRRLDVKNPERGCAGAPLDDGHGGAGAGKGPRPGNGRAAIAPSGNAKLRIVHGRQLVNAGREVYGVGLAVPVSRGNGADEGPDITCRNREYRSIPMPGHEECPEQSGDQREPRTSNWA